MGVGVLVVGVEGVVAHRGRKAFAGSGVRSSADGPGYKRCQLCDGCVQVMKGVGMGC